MKYSMPPMYRNDPEGDKFASGIRMNILFGQKMVIPRHPVIKIDNIPTATCDVGFYVKFKRHKDTLTLKQFKKRHGIK